MKVGSAHLSYCTNIHPGESLSEVQQNLQDHLLPVRDLVCKGEPFGVGLRLSALAAEQLRQPERFEAFQGFLREHTLYVFTLNGFPYGPFHGETVKEAVYQPDWSEPERATYTRHLIMLLCRLLAPGATGSLSSVPVGFKPRFHQRGKLDRAVGQLLDQVELLCQLHHRFDREIVLALEPEPCCLLETTEDAVRFFETQLLAREPLETLAGRLGCDRNQAEQRLRRHLGLCLDTCHAAVEFETAEGTLAQVRRAGLRVAKLQASAGLKLDPRSDAQREALGAYVEPVYLHQVVARQSDGSLLRFLDLPDALNNARARQAVEWRVHFHVPLYREALEQFENTQSYLSEVLALRKATAFTEHIEVETYTWDVLPAAQRDLGLQASIARELTWVQERL